MIMASPKGRKRCIIVRKYTKERSESQERE